MVHRLIAIFTCPAGEKLSQLDLELPGFGLGCSSCPLIDLPLARCLPSGLLLIEKPLLKEITFGLQSSELFCRDCRRLDNWLGETLTWLLS